MNLYIYTRWIYRPGCDSKILSRAKRFFTLFEMSLTFTYINGDEDELCVNICTVYRINRRYKFHIFFSILSFAENSFYKKDIQY